MLKDFFVTGNLHTAALVIDGSVHWLCLPRFDSDPIFARVLDRNGGHFSIEAEGYSRDTSYIKDTAVLEHRFKKDGAEFTVVDYMPPRPIDECARHVFARKIRGIRGRSTLKLVFVPTQDYARNSLQFEKSDGDLRALKGNDEIRLTFPEGTGIGKRNGDYVLETEIAEGEEKQLILEYTANGSCTGGDTVNEEEAVRFWRDWVGKGKFVERYRDTLVRAAINLKLLQFYPSGGLVAAATTSIPVEMGSMRNWDYRYVWIRDAAFTLYGFHVLGYEKEAERFFRFLQNAVREGDVKVLYTIDGKEGPAERTLDYLEGYRNSKPVRVGNQAGTQFQLDVYGSIVDAYYFAQKRGIEITSEDAAIIRRMVEHIETEWMRKDSGIWEMRLPDQHYTYSKVMAWVGADRGSRMCDVLGIDEATKDKWEGLAREIKTWIWEHCYDRERETFVMHPETKAVDASTFLFVLLQFLDKHDPKTPAIIENTAKELITNTSLVYRYVCDDGLPGRDGAFILCSFWLISAWAIIEDTDRALALFEDFEGYLSRTGLISEELDPSNHDYRGNLPQAFSHLGYIMSAYYLDRYLSRKNR